MAVDRADLFAHCVEFLKLLLNERSQLNAKPMGQTEEYKP